MVKYYTTCLKSQRNKQAVYRIKTLRIWLFKFEIVTFKRKFNITFNVNNWDK